MSKESESISLDPSHHFSPFPFPPPSSLGFHHQNPQMYFYARFAHPFKGPYLAERGPGPTIWGGVGWNGRLNWSIWFFSPSQNQIPVPVGRVCLRRVRRHRRFRDGVLFPLPRHCPQPLFAGNEPISACGFVRWVDFCMGCMQWCLSLQGWGGGRVSVCVTRVEFFHLFDFCGATSLSQDGEGILRRHLFLG